jgi:hypothetical protein
MDDVHVRHALEQLAREVRRAARTRGGVVDLPGLRFRQRDQLGDILRRHRGVRHHDEVHRDHLRHRREVAQGIDGHGGIEVLVHRQVAERSQEQGGAVGSRPGGRLGADHAARARAVVDDHLLAPGAGQPGREQARDDVGAPARREGDHDADRLRGELCPRRLGEQRGEEKRELPHFSAHFSANSWTCFARAVDSASRKARSVPVET